MFAFLDDHFRLAVGYRFGFAEDTVRLAAALEPALAARGVLASAYVDNGSAFVDAWLLRACAKLGIRLVHSTPHRPQGRGKIERFFRNVRDQFLVEVADTSAAGLAAAQTTPAAALLELNALFTAWIESVYHHQMHSETGQTPLARWNDGWDRLGHGPIMASAQALTKAFLWSAQRTVTKTATVSLHGNTYQVEAALAGRKVELVFSRIAWCIDQHALGVITGEVGAGKTVAVRAATATLDTSRHVVIYLPNPSVGVRGMRHHIVSALGQVPSFYSATLVPQTADALAAEHAERGRSPVVIIDESHLLDNQQMEAVRMLTNHEMDSGAPFAAVLIGQPTLRQRLRLGVLAALDQRISVRYTLAGMNTTETADYITHHLKIAGRTDTLFSTDAITLIHNASRGYPRAVNNLAVNALTAAFARNNPIVDEKAARIAISETGAD